MDILAKDDPTAMPSAFKAEIIKTRKDHRDLMKVKQNSEEMRCDYLGVFSSIIRVKSKVELGGLKPYGNRN